MWLRENDNSYSLLKGLNSVDFSFIHVSEFVESQIDGGLMANGELAFLARMSGLTNFLFIACEGLGNPLSL